MSTELSIQLNGQIRTIPELASPSDLAQLIDALSLKSDRVAVELNGQIVPRARWAEARVCENDRLEIVHFVGGGSR